eukprot:365906-Chlamydomonas_euryale.AAC.12
MVYCGILPSPAIGRPWTRKCWSILSSKFESCMLRYCRASLVASRHAKRLCQKWIFQPRIISLAMRCQKTSYILRCSCWS